MSKDKAHDKNIADDEGARPITGDDAAGGDQAGVAPLPEAETDKRTGGTERPVVPSTDEKSQVPEETESDRYLRLAADFDNYRKRTLREFDEITRSANARLLQSLVTVVDDFERALVEEAARGEVDAYRQGVALIYGKLQGFLKRERVTVMDVLGKPFDPTFHEALMQQPSNEYPDGIICGVVQKGYLLGDKVLRHARVIVSSGRSAANDEKNETA